MTCFNYVCGIMLQALSLLLFFLFQTANPKYLNSVYFRIKHFLIYSSDRDFETGFKITKLYGQAC